MSIVQRGPESHREWKRKRRQRRLARFAMWVAGGLIIAGAVAALWP